MRDYSTLSAFFNWCRKDKGWIEINPVENIRKPKKPAHRERRTEVEELQAILTALKYKPGTVPTTKMQEVGLIWLIAMATGMRSGDCEPFARACFCLNVMFSLIKQRMEWPEKYR